MLLDIKQLKYKTFSLKCENCQSLELFTDILGQLYLR